jgi:hypothetical protein
MELGALSRPKEAKKMREKSIFIHTKIVKDLERSFKCLNFGMVVLWPLKCPSLAQCESKPHNPGMPE